MVGRWSGRLTLVITDRAALASASMSAFDRLIWRLTALAERIFGAPWFETSVAPAEGVASDVVVHTTRVRSLFLTMVRGTEILTLDPDGRRFTMSGEHRFLWTPWRTRRVEGVGEVDADAEGASYSLSYLGAPIVQKTRVVGRALAITQTSAFGRSEVRLERVAA
jgi:hypothetical protein